jgi:hypothetical protein
MSNNKTATPGPEWPRELPLAGPTHYPRWHGWHWKLESGSPDDMHAAAIGHACKFDAEIRRRYNTQPALLAALDQISRYAGAALADGLTVKELQSILHTISTGAAKVAAATTKES